jgi:hypothetical protein
MQPLEADEPTAVGPYRLLGRLGSGGMGRVYLGRSTGGRTVAVKVVHPHFARDGEFRARFRREVEAARRVGGAWTASVLDADCDAPVPWVATAYAAGPSLAAAVADGGPLPAHTVRALGAGLAEALAAVHGLGLVHRDVKPSNVLLTLDGPLLIDFGIARALDATASLTATGVSVGSPGYMAPEQILGHGVTGAADVFSLGAVLAYAATGQPPFPGDSSAALLYKVVHGEPELDGLAGELSDLVTACLAKDPAARPAPAEVSRRLAPEGAARLIAGGWLPGRLVEQVSRSAVRLLNLEATETAEAAKAAGTAAGEAEEGSGPVGFSRASEAAPDTRTGDRRETEAPQQTVAPQEAAAPQEVVAPQQVVARQEAVARPEAGEKAGEKETPAVPGFGPPPRVPVPAPPAEPRPGKVSVTVAASSAPTAGRGRRISCTVVLAVAGAMAAVTVGSLYFTGVLPRDGGGDMGGADKRPGTTTPSATASAGDVPPAYWGTWEGRATALDGTLPIGTFRLTVHRASVGAELGRLRQTDQLGGVCVDILTLKSVTTHGLVATSRGASTNHGGCNPAPHPVHLTRTGDDLTYTSDSSAEGNPTARLTKVE